MTEVGHGSVSALSRLPQSPSEGAIGHSAGSDVLMLLTLGYRLAEYWVGVNRFRSWTVHSVYELLLLVF